MGTPAESDPGPEHTGVNSDPESRSPKDAEPDPAEGNPDPASGSPKEAEPDNTEANSDPSPGSPKEAEPEPAEMISDPGIPKISETEHAEVNFDPSPRNPKETESDSEDSEGTESSEGDDQDMSCKQRILNELENINRRLDVNLTKWEKHNATYEVTVQKDGPMYPKGFGFYLMNEKCPPPPTGSDLETLYQTVMDIPDMEVQDGLLSFLDDVRAQGKFLRDVKHEREELLTSVAEWMGADTSELRAVRSTHLGVAVEAEEELRTCYDEALGNMERLCMMKKQLMLLEKSRNKQMAKMPHETRDVADLEKEGGTSTSSVSLGLEDKELFGGGPATGPAMELVKMMQDNRDENNDSEMEALVNKLEEVIKVTVNGEEEVKSVRDNLFKNREEYKKMQDEYDESKAEMERLVNRVKELESTLPHVKADASSKEAEGSDATAAESRGVQTDIEGAMDDDVLKASIAKVIGPVPQGRQTDHKKLMQEMPVIPIKDFTKGSEKDPGKEGSEQLVREPSETSPEDVPDEVALETKAARKGSDRADRMSVPRASISAAPRAKAKVSFRHGTHEGSADLKTQARRDSTKLAGMANTADHPRDTGTTTEAKRSKFRHHSRSKRDEEWDQAGSQVEGEAPKEDDLTMEQLKEMLKKHIQNSISNVQSLVEELIALRKNARDEIHNIKMKEASFQCVEEEIQMCLDTAVGEKDRLPAIDMFGDGKKVRVVNRMPENHKCRFCVCHETTPPTVVLSDDNSHILLPKTMQLCKQYSQILDTMKDTYTETWDVLTKGHDAIHKIMEELVWGELGTSDYNFLDKDFDEELCDVADNLKKVPTDMPQLADHAVIVADNMDAITKKIVTILHDAKIRMTDIKTQSEDLIHLEEAIDNVRSKMDGTALQLSRLRAKEDFLRTGRVLGLCMCPYCKCYDSPMADNSREPSTDKQIATKQILKRSVALLQQAMGAVIRNVDTEDDSFVSAVSPEIVELVDDARNKLFQALKIVAEETDE